MKWLNISPEPYRDSKAYLENNSVSVYNALSIHTVDFVRWKLIACPNQANKAFVSDNVND